MAQTADYLALDAIRLDGGTQPRSGIDYDAVDDYTEAMNAGIAFPPVVVFYDGSHYWLADGFHRYRATEQTGSDQIACEVRQGTQQDAQWYSYSANKTNGLRRTNEDKQRAVKAALLHPHGSTKSDTAIAKHVGVSQHTVSNWRARLEATQKLSESTARTGADGRTINTANIGKVAKQAAPDPSADKNVHIPIDESARWAAPQCSSAYAAAPAPAPAPATALATPPVPSTVVTPPESDVMPDTRPHDLARTYLDHIVRACIAITNCADALALATVPLVGQSATHIQNSHLEKAHEILTSILSCRH